MLTIIKIVIVKVLIITLALANATDSKVAEGSLSRYDDGIMEATIDWRVWADSPRGFDPNPDLYDGYIAVADCKLVGEQAVLEVELYDEIIATGLVLISDCSGHVETSEWMAADQIVAELDYDTWVEWGLQDGTGGWATVTLVDGEFQH